tara:strand:+ start:525 stop:767 length:243 start_codon:yes stop_codon:yes gene_type:complete
MRRLNPSVATKFLRILVHVDWGSTPLQPAQKISLLLSDKTSSLSLFTLDLRRKNITVSIPEIDHFITQRRETDFFLDLAK